MLNILFFENTITNLYFIDSKRKHFLAFDLMNVLRFKEIN